MVNHSSQMKANNKQNNPIVSEERFFPYDFFLLRAPAFSIESVFRLNDILNQLEKDPGSLIIIDRLKKEFSHPLFVEAIFFASNDLYIALTGWLKGKQIDSAKLSRMLSSLHRYYSRMCTRCTPYGMFAGCATGEISEAPSKIEFAEKKVDRHVRFNMDFIGEIAQSVAKKGTIREQALYHLNNSIYKVDNKLIYVERLIHNGRSTYVLSALTSSPFIEKVLTAASEGLTIAQLEAIVQDGNLSAQSVSIFINRLIDMQVLVTELTPTVTGEDFVKKFLLRLGEMDPSDTVYISLKKAFDVIVKKNTELSDFIKAKKILEPLVTRNINALQEDLHYKMNQNHLNVKLLADIMEISYRLWQTTTFSTPAKLTEFSEKFLARYEQREIPLTIAIDPDYGIGYGLATSGIAEDLPLLTGLALKAPSSDTHTSKSAFSRLLSEKMKIFYKEKSDVLHLTESDIDGLINANPSSELSQRNSAYIFGSLLCSSSDDLDKGNYKFIANQLHAFSTARLMGRFALGEKKLEEKLLQCMQDEQSANPDLILAEVVHMPDGNSANVVLRPVLRKHEIPYLCNSAVDKKYQIDISDLMVSVRNQRVVLRSLKLGKEILPQLTNAHNVQLSQPIYRFLSDVRAQRVSQGFSWEWREYHHEPYLPRVEYKNFILSRARWMIKQEQTCAISNTDEIKQYIDRLRKELSLPRYLVLAQDADNELFIDLENAMCRNHIIRRLKNQDIFLFEYLNLPENSFVKDDSGSYNNQLIIPIGTRLPIFKEKLILASPNTHEVQRSFAPGGEWLYLKIYGGGKSLEKLLIELINPFARQAFADETIDKWFFIRYNDPNTHLRIRFHKSPASIHWHMLLPDLSEKLAKYLELGVVHNIVVDTYEREIERYGPLTIEQSEDLFCADSTAICDFLDEVETENKEQMRWQMGILGIDSLLDDFSLSLSGKLEIMKSLKEVFTNEFGNGIKDDIGRLEYSLNNKFRIDLPHIKAILDDDSNENFPLIKDCLRQRSSTNKKIIEELIRCLSYQKSNLEIINQLIASYIHMFINRLFISRQRAHELVLYHYLTKYYKSQLSRKEKDTRFSCLEK